MASTKKKESQTLFDDVPTEEIPAEEVAVATPEAPPAPQGVDKETYDEMVAILSPQRGKRAVPTMIGFVSPMANTKRYAVVDISDVLLDEAYRCWLSHGYRGHEEFLSVIYRITHSDVPRMYRTVAFLDLDRIDQK